MWLVAFSLSESETPAEGRHAGESHLSPESAARREAGAHRWHSGQQPPAHFSCSALWTKSLILCFGSLPENTKLIDVYLFLFDEFLLITKIKRNKKVCRPLALIPTRFRNSGSHFSLSAEVHKFWAELSEAAAEPGAGSAAEGGLHLHGSGPAHLFGPTPAEEHRSAQRLQ